MANTERERENRRDAVRTITDRTPWLLAMILSIGVLAQFRSLWEALLFAPFSAWLGYQAVR